MCSTCNFFFKEKQNEDGGDSGSDSSVMSVKTLASYWRAKTYSALSFDNLFQRGAFCIWFHFQTFGKVLLFSWAYWKTFIFWRLSSDNHISCPALISALPKWSRIIYYYPRFLCPFCELRIIVSSIYLWSANNQCRWKTIKSTSVNADSCAKHNTFN